MALIKRLAMAGHGLLNGGITPSAFSVAAASKPKKGSLMMMSTSSPAANKLDDENSNYCRSKSGRLHLALSSLKGYVYEMKEDSEGRLHLKVEMPGLGKDDVKVSFSNQVLKIEAQGEDDGDGDGDGDDEDNNKLYVFPNHLWFKAEGTTAKMKNGVLELFVPGIKDEDRKPLFKLKIN